MKWINTTLLATVSIILCACSPWTQISEGMQPMIGQDINNLFARLGYPNNEGRIAGRHYYIWSVGSSLYIPDTQTTNGTGYVGTTPFNYQQTTYGGGSVAQLHCILRVFVDDKNHITNWDGNGANGACEQFANRLGG